MRWFLLLFGALLLGAGVAGWLFASTQIAPLSEAARSPSNNEWRTLQLIRSIGLGSLVSGVVLTIGAIALLRK